MHYTFYKYLLNFTRNKESMGTRRSSILGSISFTFMRYVIIMEFITVASIGFNLILWVTYTVTNLDLT